MFHFERLIASRFYQSGRGSGFLSFITTFAIGGVAIGSAAMIITLAIVNGFSDEIQKKLVAFGSHISLNTFSGDSFLYPDEKLAPLDTSSFITRVSPVFSRQALARSGKNLEGVLVNGIQAEHLPARLSGYLSDGRFFMQDDTVNHPLVIGKKLAEMLQAKIGSKIAFFGISGMPSPGNFPNVVQGTVVGVFDTGMQGFDDLYVYLPLESAQELFKKPGEITDISLETIDLYRADEFNDILQDELPWPYFTRSIFQSQANLFGWIGLQQQMIPIIILSLILIAIVNIIGTILMMVVDKTKEIGILRAMGSTGKQMLAIFIGQGVIITGIGLVIGNFIGITFCILQKEFELIPLPQEAYFMDSVPIRMEIPEILIVNILTMVVAVIASWIPSLVASKLPVSETVRFG